MTTPTRVEKPIVPAGQAKEIVVARHALKLPRYAI